MVNRRVQLSLWEGVETTSFLFGSNTAVEGVFRGSTDAFDYERLRRTSLTVARGLSKVGLRRGDVVALWLPNWIEWIVLEFAAARLGATVLGLNTRFRTEEMTHFLGAARPKMIVYPSEFLDIDFADILGTALANLAARGDDLTLKVLTVGRPQVTGTLHFDDLFARGEESATGDELLGGADDLCNIFTTSGSTSLPKLAGHVQGALTRHARSAAMAFDMRRDDAVLGLLPLCGAFGLNSALSILSVGGKLILQPIYDEDRARQLVGRGDVTHLFCGDDVVARLCLGTDADFDSGRLRRGGIANFSGRSEDVIIEVELRYGIRLSGVYGSSETFALAATWPVDMEVAERARSGGVPVDPAIVWRIADVESGDLVDDDSIGELQFKGYNVLERYIGVDADTGSASSGDEWFRSGDLGYRSGEGFVFVARGSQVVRLSGFLVYPEEVERAVRDLPIVDDAWVVGARDSSSVQLVAFVRVKPGSNFDEQEIRRTCQLRLASFKVPFRIIEIDEVPMTVGTNGAKVDLAGLRREAQRYLAAAVTE
jgi:acyl-CoA synthetase (AMP-forming)/AMP-acid ligase II